MKPIAILASLLTLAAAQDVPTTPDDGAAVEPRATAGDVEPVDLGDGPLATILRDRSSLYIDMAKTKHTPVRSRSRDPFRLPTERTSGESIDTVAAQQASAAAAGTGDAQVPASEAQAPPTDPNAAVVESVRALPINAVLIAKEGGSCLVRGDILRVGDTILGGRATLKHVARDGVSFSVGDELVDVALVDPRSKPASDESTPVSSSASEDTNP